EEHDPSYKQESDPRYDARTVAAKRAALEGAVAIYGSATPRPESWERLERLELGGRLGGSLPGVRVVDLRREAGYPLSAPLLRQLGAIEEHGGKAILLLNRRGVAPALHCRACGTTFRCPLCDVALVLHGEGRLRCHLCGVALAAVIDADTALGVPDFRAEERTFQLLTQLAGRSGRDAPGRVLIQTFQPDSRPVELAARHDVLRFLTGELERRRELGYPPFRHLVRVLVSGPEPGPVTRALEE